MRTRSGKEILELFDLELEKMRRKIRSDQSTIGDNTRAELERLQNLVKQLIDEKAAREEQERKIREIVPVMHMFNHGNTITFPEGPRIDANNFELRMPLIQRVELYPFAGRATEDVNRHLTKFVEIANTLKLNGVKSHIFS